MQRLANLFFFLVTILLLIGSVAAGEIPLRFKAEENTVIKESGEILSIFQDQPGLLWFGTRKGLVRYDAYEFVRYDQIKDATGKIVENKSVTDIYTIYQDKDANIWVGTLDGLYQFDQTEGEFIHYPNNSEKYYAEKNTVTAIFQDSVAHFWIGTSKGLFQFDPNATEKFKSVPHLDKEIIRAIDGKQDVLWVGTDAGLFKGVQNQFSLQPNSPEFVSAIYAADDDKLWLGTLGQGLHTFDLKTQQFQRYDYDLGSRKIFSITAGNEGDNQMVWLGTDRGVIRINQKTQEKTGAFCPQEGKGCYVPTVYHERSGALFAATPQGLFKSWPGMYKFFPYPQSEKGLRASDVRAITEDTAGNIWVGTHLGGLTKISPKGEFSSFFENAQIRAIAIDNGILWIGTSNNGLFKFDLDGKMLAPSPYPLNEKITSVLIKEGKIWVGTDGDGLHLFDPQTGTFSEHFSSEQGLSDNRVSVIQDLKDTLWIGTEKGLNNYQEGIFVHYLEDHKILSLHQQTQSDKLWVGTDNGLISFNLSKASIEGTFLSGEKIHGILEDEAHQQLWLSTDKGLSQFDPEKNVVTGDYNENSKPKLEIRNFNADASHKTQNGRMFFGSGQGMVAFYPEDILAKNKYEPPVVITSLQVNDIPQSINESLKNGLKLKSSDFLEFRFTALSYIEPEVNQCRSQLEGHEKDWSKPSSKDRYVKYVVRGGVYTLKIKCSNNDGVWKENAIAMNIDVEPSFLEKTWVRVAVALFIITMVALVVFAVVQSRSKKRIEKAKNETEKAKIRAESIAEELRVAKDKVESAKIQAETDAERLRAIIKVGQRIAEGIRLDERAFWNAIYTEISLLRYVDTRNMYIALYNQGYQELTFPLAFWMGKMDTVPPRKIDMNSDKGGFTEIALKTGKTLNIGDGEKYCRENNIILPVPPTPKSYLGVPMVTEKNLLGIISLQDNDRNDAYSPEDAKVIEVIAGQCAVAIRIANFYQETDRQAKKIEIQTKEIEIQTERWRKTQAKLDALQRLSVMAQVAAEFAHRMNNLAATIPVRVSIAREKLARNHFDKVIGQLEGISEDATRLLQASHEIKKSTEPKVREPVIITELLENTLKTIWRSRPEIENRINVETSFSADVPTIYIERSRLEESLNNVVNNAIDAMPNGGTLSITCKNTDINERHTIEIDITDTGTGIPSKLLPKIFDLFFTTKGTGLGYGLWRDKTFLKAMGGNIDVKTEEGKGSTFTLTIPIEESIENT